MTSLRFRALSTEVAGALRAGEPDANGQPPERHVANGTGNPCRHCLAEIGDGQPMLVLAHRPFPVPQPYAEIGPVFLHAGPCDRYRAEADVPPMFLVRERLLIRRYGDDDRIVYGTGQVVPMDPARRGGQPAPGASGSRLPAGPLGKQQRLPVPDRPRGLTYRLGRRPPALPRPPLRQA